MIFVLAESCELAAPADTPRDGLRSDLRHILHNFMLIRKVQPFCFERSNELSKPFRLFFNSKELRIGFMFYISFYHCRERRVWMMVHHEQ